MSHHDFSPRINPSTLLKSKLSSPKNQSTILNTAMGQQNPPELPSLPAGKSRLRRAINFISTLISLSYSIKVFTAKWYMIRNRLQELLSGLKVIDRIDSRDDLSLSGEVTQTVIDTLFECNELGKKCIEMTFSGRLLMQSDLSALVCKIDTHIDCLSEICTVGLSTNSTVAQKPGALASIDDMKVYVKDLLSRLKVGDIHMKKQALLAFNQVIQEDEEHVEICMENHDIVSNLANFLDSGVIDIQEESAKMACLISKFDVYRGELAGAGLIPPLIRVLECGSRVGQECAARCLMNMTEKSNYAWSVLAHDGVTVLLDMGRNVEACGSELVVLACGVLKNLGREEEINKFMVQEGALEIFITLAKSGNNVVLLSSIGCLQIMASTNELNRNLIVKEGGIFVLLDVLDPRSLISSEAREMALEAIMILCLESTSSLNIVMDYGFIDQMLLFLQHGFSRVQELALKATVWLCEASEEAKMTLGDAGFLLELVKFLNAKSLEARELAAKALLSMMSVPKNRKRLVQNQESVGVLVQLLDQEEGNSGDRKLLLSILMALTSSTSGRKRIVNSGYVQNIEKLAEDEVIDAHKLFRKSTSNKISSVFSQMWQ